MKLSSKVKTFILMIALAFAVLSCKNSVDEASPSENKENTKPTPAPEIPDFTEVPLTLEFTAEGKITISNPWSTLRFEKGGKLITVETNDTLTIPVTEDEKISFYAEKSENNASTYMSINCNSDCYVYGNIMSLVTFDDESSSWDSSATTLTTLHSFRELFSNNRYINIHRDKSLVLPATTLTESCYSYMFCWCSSLTSAPVLPATSLAEYCYDSMFYGCTSLTSAPKLPALSLKNGCYFGMFLCCSSLTSAPDLPAATLVPSCYYLMFYSCKKLNYIKCLATDISEGGSTLDWIEGVAAEGTFVKAADTDWSVKTGKNGIPEGWTVKNASEETDA